MARCKKYESAKDMLSLTYLNLSAVYSQIQMHKKAKIYAKKSAVMIEKEIEAINKEKSLQNISHISIIEEIEKDGNLETQDRKSKEASLL